LKKRTSPCKESPERVEIISKPNTERNEDEGALAGGLIKRPAMGAGGRLQDSKKSIQERGSAAGIL